MVIEASLTWVVCLLFGSFLYFPPTDLWPFYGFCWSRFENKQSPIQPITPFAVHYEKIRIYLRESSTNSAKIHSLARKSEHLRINQIQ